MKIDPRKLRNNSQLDNDLKELAIYVSDNKPDDVSTEIYEVRKAIYKDAYHKMLDSDVSIIVKPNHEFKPYLNSKDKYKHMEEYNDYEINVYWKQVSVATYSEFCNTLYVDHLLGKDEWFVDNILSLVKPEIPKEDFSICYGSYYADFDIRPFIVGT